MLNLEQIRKKGEILDHNIDTKFPREIWETICSTKQIPFEQYPYLIKLLRRYDKHISKDDNLKNEIKKVLGNIHVNRLLICFIAYQHKIYQNTTKCLREAFKEFIVVNKNNLSLWKNKDDISFFESPRESDVFYHTVKWFYHVRSGNELIYCDLCDSLLIPDFEKIHNYVCSNNECTNSNHAKYSNVCWNCHADVDSDYNKQCAYCGWYICNECASCDESELGGCKASKVKDVPIKHEIKEPKYIYDKSSTLSEYSLYLNSLCEDAIKKYQRKRTNNYELFYQDTDRGTKVLDKDDELESYMAMYGAMHCIKLVIALKQVRFQQFSGKDISIYDWGCGQGLGTLSLLDYIRQNKSIEVNVKSINLFEPSQKAADQAVKYIKSFIGTDKSNIIINVVNKSFDELKREDVKDEDYSIHILSNILDVNKYDLESFCEKIKSVGTKKAVYLCVSPRYVGAIKRVDRFVNNISSYRELTYKLHTSNAIQANIYNILKKKNTKRLITRYQYILER